MLTQGETRDYVLSFVQMQAPYTCAATKSSVTLCQQEDAQ
jgi:hypothetical protein